MLETPTRHKIYIGVALASSDWSNITSTWYDQ